MITQGFLARHFQGRAGMRDAALLDVAQDYALKHLFDEGIFELGVILKGGTALRKFRAGNSGRFSTDLDFATPDSDCASLLLDSLDNAELFEVRFRLRDREPLRAKLVVETPLGQPSIPARVEISPRPLWLPTVLTTPLALPVHDGYEFSLPALPAPALEETLAEKLAAWRRRRKLRDLYDLFLFGNTALDEALVRRLLVLKIWHDVVVDGLGSRPFNPSDIVDDVDLRLLASEDIGLLKQPVEPRTWLSFVRNRYSFVTDLDEVERRISLCNPADRREITQMVAALR